MMLGAQEQMVAIKTKRERLKDNEVGADSLRSCLKQWFVHCGDRLIDRLLSIVSSELPARGMPTPSQLVAIAPYSLVKFVANVDPSLHPRHARLATAILAEHGVKKVFDGGRGLELECMLLSRLILGVLRKYRDMVKYEDKRASVLKKSSQEERQKLEQVFSMIILPNSEGPQLSPCTEIVTFSAGSVAARPPPSARDELGDLALELGSFSAGAVWGAGCCQGYVRPFRNKSV